MTSDAKDTWTKTRTSIILIAKEILGESHCRFRVKKDITWWNEEVKKVIKEKKCYLTLGR